MLLKKINSDRKDYVNEFVKYNNCITRSMLYVRAADKLIEIGSGFKSEYNSKIKETVYFSGEAYKEKELIINNIRTKLLDIYGVRDIELIYDYCFRDICFDGLLGFDIVTDRKKFKCIFLLVVDLGGDEMNNLIKLDQDLELDNNGLDIVPIVMVINSTGKVSHNFKNILIVSINYKCEGLARVINRLEIGNEMS